MQVFNYQIDTNRKSIEFESSSIKTEFFCALASSSSFKMYQLRFLSRYAFR